MTSKPAILSDTARTVLAAAAARDDRLAVEPVKLPRAACSAVARTLLRAGWVERADAAPEALWYPEPGRATGLRVTDAGLRASGVEPDLDEPDRAIPEVPPVGAARSAPEARVAGEGCGITEDTDGAPALPQAVGRDAPTSLRRAAQDVVQAWSDEASQRASLPEAVERLRALLARPTATRPSTAMPRRPREDTKQAQVLARLRRPEGASGPQIAEATGWAPHTVRGFLATLARKGVPVAVLERVRQVGPDKQGTKGSYTVYHVADAG